MTTTAEATAAPSFIELGGRRLLMTPLKDQDYGIFERWIQDRHIDLAKRMVKDLEPEERLALLKHAYDKARRITISSPEASELMTSVEGAVKLVWLALRKEQPDVTEEMVFDWLSDEKTLEQMLDKIDGMNTAPPFRKGRRRGKGKRRRGKRR